MENLNQEWTGKWTCLGDDGTYYITALGNNLYISGVTSGETCFNVGFGVINVDQNSAVVSWSDTPQSAKPASNGVEYLKLSDANTITKVQGSSFAYGNFTKCVD